MLTHVTERFRSAWTLVDSATGDSSESDSEKQTRAEARFWHQKLSNCYTNGRLLHKFSSEFLCESVLFNKGVFHRDRHWWNDGIHHMHSQVSGPPFTEKHNSI